MPSQPSPSQSPETSQAMMAALREAGSGAVAPSGYMQTGRTGYTFKVGPIPFRIGAGLGFQFNDNIYSSSTAKVSDLIVTPNIYLSGNWQITSINSLSLSLGIGYSAYLNHPDLNSVTRTVGLTPGLNTNALSFKMKVGDLYFNFYDRPQLGLNSYDLLTSPSGLFNYSLTNVIGASVFWDLNDVRIDAQYTHVNTIPLTSQSASVNSANNPNVQQQDQGFLDSLQNAQDSLTASATLRINDNTSVGLEFAATKFTYAGDFQNNGISYHGGMFVGTQLSQYITLRLAGGYQQMTFDSGGLNQDNSGYSKPYVNLELHHRVNRFLSHTLTVGNEGDLGTTSNSVQTAYITEAVTFQVTKAVTLSMFASYETGKESGGPNAQSLNLLNLGLSTGFNLTKKLQMSVYYQFLMRSGQDINDSQNSTQFGNQVSSNYTQNVFGIYFSYEL